MAWNQEAFAPGDLVTWERERRGGFCVIDRIPGVVVSIGLKRIRIRVQLRDGSYVIRPVGFNRLRRREPRQVQP